MRGQIYGDKPDAPAPPDTRGKEFWDNKLKETKKEIYEQALKKGWLRNGAVYPDEE